MPKKLTAKQRESRNAFAMWAVGIGVGIIVAVGVAIFSVSYYTDPPVIHLTCGRNFAKISSPLNEYKTVFIHDGKVDVRDAAVDSGMLTIRPDVIFAMHQGFVRCELHNSGGKAAQNFSLILKTLSTEGNTDATVAFDSIDAGKTATFDILDASAVVAGGSTPTQGSFSYNGWGGNLSKHDIAPMACSFILTQNLDIRPLLSAPQGSGVTCGDELPH
jgi:hypothetical protein